MAARMSIEEIARALRLGELEEPFRRSWSASERSLSLEAPFFLEERFVREQAAFASLPGEAAERLVGVARRCLADPALRLLLWHEHRLFTGAGPAAGPRPRPLHRRAAKRGAAIFDADPAGFPDLSPALGDEASAANLLLALSALPNTRWLYESRRIPPSVLRDTLSDFPLRLLPAAGIDVTTLAWLQHHVAGRLFRLGRLQFKLGSFPRELTVYRSEVDSRVCAIAAPGLSVDGRGLLLFGGGGIEEWRTARRESDGVVYGNPVLPEGVIAHEEIALDLAGRRSVLGEKSPVLEIHIPAGAPLSPESCADSFARAVEFFPAYFPERLFHGFTCESWFLGRELLDLLAPASNIRRFASELYLYPCAGGEEEAQARIFGPSHRTLPPSQWPRATSLQRRAADHLAAGGGFRLGGGFLLVADLPWGRRVYGDLGTCGYAGGRAASG